MTNPIKYEMIQLKLLKSIFIYNSKYHYPGNGEMIAIGVSLENGGEFFDHDTRAHFLQSFRTRADHEMPFTLEVEFAALFSLSDPVPSPERHYFMKQLFPQVVFPYLREYVAETTRRGGFPPLLINHSLFPDGPAETGDIKEMTVSSKWLH